MRTSRAHYIVRSLFLVLGIPARCLTLTNGDTMKTTIKVQRAQTMQGGEYAYVTVRTAKRHGFTSAEQLPSVAGFTPFREPTVHMREHGGSVYVAVPE